MSKRNHPLYGTGTVFRFTLKQMMQGTMFKVMTYLVPLLLLILSGGILTYLSYHNLEDTGGRTEETALSRLVVVSTMEEGNWLLEMDLESAGLAPTLLDGQIYETLEDGVAALGTETDTGAILELQPGEEGYALRLLTDEGGEVSENEKSLVVEVALASLQKGLAQRANLSTEAAALLLQEPVSDSVILGEGSALPSMLVKMILPMLVCLVLYMVVVLYGQSIGKIVIAEKTSRLMEMLLTNIQPYGLIAGKILAVAFLGVIQILGWVLAIALGLYGGNQLSESVNPAFYAQLQGIWHLISLSTDVLEWPNILLGTTALLIGFLFYCVLAGFFASFAQKAEDLGSANGLFSMVSVAGYLLAYLVPLSAENGTPGAFYWIPFTAAFALPGDIFIGTLSRAQGMAMLAVLALATMGLALLTGKVYRDGVFYNGESLFARLPFGRKKEKEKG